MEMTRREFLGGLPKTALKLAVASQALSGLDSLVFGEEDYLSKLPPLNGRKVTEELIQEMLNVGSVRGILEKYGNKDNIFYVQFKPDGRNSLDELVRKDPEKWDGSYVLISDNNPYSLRQAIVTLFLNQKESRVRFILYVLSKDLNVSFNKQIGKYISDEEHFLIKLFQGNFGIPAMLIYSNKGTILDGGHGGPYSKEYIGSNFRNESIWIRHQLYQDYKTDDDGTEIIIRYNFSKDLKKEVKSEDCQNKTK